MNSLTEALREKAREKLSDGTVRLFIAYTAGLDPYRPVPFFATSQGDAGQVLVDEFCAFNLAKYLLGEQQEEGRVGLVVKGCDSLGLLRLIKDNRVSREKAYIVGIPCTGILDADKVAALGLGEITGIVDQGSDYLVKAAAGERRLEKKEYLLKKCLQCETRNPAVYDEMLGPEVDNAPVVPRNFSAVRELEGLTAAEKEAFWQRQYERCIRCFACRNVCPACNCRECCLDQADPAWIGKETTVSEQQMFHFIRAFDVAGRCVDCGECERVCPMDLPLMLLNRKLIKDIEELFAVEKAHVPQDAEPLGYFRPDDRDEFN